MTGDRRSEKGDDGRVRESRRFYRKEVKGSLGISSNVIVIIPLVTGERDPGPFCQLLIIFELFCFFFLKELHP